MSVRTHITALASLIITVLNTVKAQNTFTSTGPAGVNTLNPIGHFQVRGDSWFDASTKFYLTNNATDFGRTSFIITGRFQALNDAWTFGSGARNAIVFAQNEADSGVDVGVPGDEKFSIQLEGNSRSLGFLSKQMGSTPNLVMAQNGFIGLGLTTPRTKFDVWGGDISVTGTDHNGTAIISSSGGTSYFANNQLNNGIAIDYFGHVGVGTGSPRALLDVATYSGSGGLASVLSRMPEGDASGTGTYLGIKGYETTFSNYNGKTFALEHSFYGQTNSAVNFYRGGSQTGGFMTFSTNNNTERMRIDPWGNVGIGVTNPTERLTVNGKIKANEIRVDGTNAPDYVFDDGYKVETLQALESYIKANKHLPEMPSAKEFERDGMAVGEMNKLLLKKIEELTLHMIEMNKRVEKLEVENQKLKNNGN